MNKLEILVGDLWVDIAGRSEEIDKITKYFKELEINRSNYDYFVIQQEGVKFLVYRREKD